MYIHKQLGWSSTWISIRAATNDYVSNHSSNAYFIDESKPDN